MAMPQQFDTDILYNGRTKAVFKTDHQELVSISFKELGVSGNAEACLKLNELFFNILNDNNIPTHFLDNNEKNSFLATTLSIIPVTIAVRNFASGSICSRQNIQKGTWFPYPYVEYFYGDEILSEKELMLNKILNFDEIMLLNEVSKLVCKLIYDYLIAKNLKLVDVKVKFGKNKWGNYFVAGDFSPNKMRVWKVSEQNELNAIDLLALIEENNKSLKIL
ncbi:MAG: phosphoribosylaminoimidazolesuccinocarboxamide synthase [Candidatus Gastranaerophilales bacterium]|nr:phosphoribosylaminoimidazolesuccinocarboxamide synthase [Candidatus Gastranaerophilales bacterium]